MSNEVEVNYGDNAAGTASRLLAAARALDLETSVVKTTSDSVFLVPEEVADEAGLSYDIVEVPEDDQGADESDDQDSGDQEALEVPDGSLEDSVTWVTEGEDESERTKRANAAHLKATEGGLEGVELEEFEGELSEAVHGSTPEPEPELPIGKALEQALKDAGLPTSGNKADKQARLAEHLNKE